MISFDLRVALFTVESNRDGLSTARTIFAEKDVFSLVVWIGAKRGIRFWRFGWTRCVT